MHPWNRDQFRKFKKSHSRFIFFIRHIRYWWCFYARRCAIFICFLFSEFDYSVYIYIYVNPCSDYFHDDANKFFFLRAISTSHNEHHNARSKLNPTLPSGGRAPPRQKAVTFHQNFDWTACPVWTLRRLLQQRKTTSSTSWAFTLAPLCDAWTWFRSSSEHVLTTQWYDGSLPTNVQRPHQPTPRV